MALARAASRRAAAAARVDTPILLYTFWMWLSAVLTEIPNTRAICFVCNPRARRRMTSVSRWVSPAGRSIRGVRWPAASSTALTATASSRPTRTSPVSVSAACSGVSGSRCGLGSIFV